MIYPAIDLMDGGCVRLYKGDFNQRTNYDACPIETAKGFATSGAQWIHIVDLDGAKSGRAEQGALIMQIARESGLKVQTGGGLKSLEQIERLLDGGVARVVIGTLAVSQPETVRGWIKTLGADKFCLALDVQIDESGTPRPALHGWTKPSEQTLYQVIDAYKGTGLRCLLVTDIAKDGVLGGANVALYQDLIARYGDDIDLITSGGVGTLEDVKALKSLSPHGIIIGKALYENRFTLESAITC
ncbi:MAG: 1-(5-phosphoribosyl)-5-[(5-phosphoribosylamino)methylideneamino]imidazole-4-carboxamide isomerase [Robiginitomaculum sp.]